MSQQPAARSSRLAEGELVPGQSTSRLLCPVCCELFQDPVFVPSKCQCVFCRSCLEESLKVRNNCPLCQASLVGEALQPHRWVRDSLDELLVVCPGKCGWRGTLGARKSHLESCRLLRSKEELKEVTKRLEVNLADQLELKEEQKLLEEEKQYLEEEQTRLLEAPAAGQQPETEPPVEGSTQQQQLQEQQQEQQQQQQQQQEQQQQQQQQGPQHRETNGTGHVKGEARRSGLILPERKEFGRQALQEKVKEQEKVLNDARCEIKSKDSEISTLFVRLQAEQRESEKWRQATHRSHPELQSLRQQVAQLKQELSARRDVEEKAKAAAKSEAKREAKRQREQAAAKSEAKGEAKRQREQEPRASREAQEKAKVAAKSAARVPKRPSSAAGSADTQTQRTRQRVCRDPRLARLLEEVPDESDEEPSDVQLDPQQVERDQNSDALRAAAKETDVNQVQLLLSQGLCDVNSQESQNSSTWWTGYTALHWAARYGSVDIAKLLMKARADVNVALDDGTTPLHLAASLGQQGVFEFLVIKANADVEAQLKDGSTALHIVAKAGYDDLVKLLVEQGRADVNAKTKAGTTPFDMAKKKSTRTILEDSGGSTGTGRSRARSSKG